MLLSSLLPVTSWLYLAACFGRNASADASERMAGESNSCTKLRGLGSMRGKLWKLQAGETQRYCHAGRARVRGAGAGACLNGGKGGFLNRGSGPAYLPARLTTCLPARLTSSCVSSGEASPQRSYDTRHWPSGCTVSAQQFSCSRRYGLATPTPCEWDTTGSTGASEGVPLALVAYISGRRCSGLRSAPAHPSRAAPRGQGSSGRGNGAPADSAGRARRP